MISIHRGDISRSKGRQVLYWTAHDDYGKRKQAEKQAVQSITGRIEEGFLAGKTG